jgi:hypothetical protein
VLQGVRQLWSSAQILLLLQLALVQQFPLKQPPLHPVLPGPQSPPVPQQTDEAPQGTLPLQPAVHFPELQISPAPHCLSRVQVPHLWLTHACPVWQSALLQQSPE